MRCRGSDLNARVPAQQGLFVQSALLSPAPWTKLGYPCSCDAPLISSPTEKGLERTTHGHHGDILVISRVRESVPHTWCSMTHNTSVQSVNECGLRSLLQHNEGHRQGFVCCSKYTRWGIANVVSPSVFQVIFSPSSLLLIYSSDEVLKVSYSVLFSDDPGC